MDGLASGLLGGLQSGFISPVHSPFLLARHLMGKYSEHGPELGWKQSPCFLADIFPHLSTMWRLLLRRLYVLSCRPPVLPILRTPQRVQSKFVFGWFRLIPFLQWVLEKYKPVWLHPVMEASLPARPLLREGPIVPAQSPHRSVIASHCRLYALDLLILSGP